LRVVYGVNPVRELLRAGGEGPLELWLAEGAAPSRALGELEHAARERGAKVRRAPRAGLDRLAGSDGHQGVVAVVSDYRYRDPDELLDIARSRGEPPLLVVLDGIEDPRNLGAIIRSAYVLGAHGVVVARDRAVGLTPVAMKASAGAAEHCPVARVVNISKHLEELKTSGVWSVGASPDGDREIAQVDLTGPTAIVIGAEGGGLRPLVRRTCDHLARIPMSGQVASLSASAAASICLYEAARQRRP